jgi:hypothetical protein
MESIEHRLWNSPESPLGRPRLIQPIHLLLTVANFYPFIPFGLWKRVQIFHSSSGVAGPLAELPSWADS